jgi:hypothetical protein
MLKACDSGSGKAKGGREYFGSEKAEDSRGLLGPPTKYSDI